MYLIDTNVLFELRRVRSGRVDPRVAAWAEATPAAEMFVSVITLQEIEIGVLLMERRDPAQGAVLRRWYEGALLVGFAGRLLPVDATVARRSAPLNVPDPRPVHDGLIAATALAHGLAVVTRQRGGLRADRGRGDEPVALRSVIPGPTHEGLLELGDLLWAV